MKASNTKFAKLTPSIVKIFLVFFSLKSYFKNEERKEKLYVKLNLLELKINHFIPELFSNKKFSF